MWKRQVSKVYQDIQKEEIWQAWLDVTHWPEWDSELEYCENPSAFLPGQSFILKPKQGPKIKIILSEVIINEKFTDYCKFPGAKMFNTHEITFEPNGIRISQTITVTGPFSFLWSALVAKKFVQSIPQQTDNLVNWVRSKRGS